MFSFISRFKYLQSGSWLLFEQALRVLISTCYILLLTAHLGPNDFGIFIFALTLIGIIRVFINFGAEDILVKLLGSRPANFINYLSAAFYIKIFINTLIFMVFLIIYLSEINQSFILLSLIILLAFNLFSAFDIISFYYESRVDGRKIAFCKLAQLICITFIKIYLLLGQYELVFFIVVHGLEFFFLGIFYCISFRSRILKLLANKFNFEKYKNIISESFGYLLIGIVGVLFVRVDQLMVKNILGFEQLGYFGLCVRFIDVLFLLPIIFSKTIFPLMIEKSKNAVEYKKFLKDIFVGIVWFSIILNLLTLFIGNYLIKSFLPESNYIISFNVFIIYIWALIPYFFNQVTYRWLMIENKIKDNLIRTLLALIANFLLNFFLIPIFGIYGAAISTLVSLIFLSFILDYVFIYSRRLFHYKLQAFNPLALYRLYSNIIRK